MKEVNILTKLIRNTLKYKVFLVRNDFIKYEIEKSKEKNNLEKITGNINNYYIVKTKYIKSNTKQITYKNSLMYIDLTKPIFILNLTRVYLIDIDTGIQLYLTKSDADLYPTIAYSLLKQDTLKTIIHSIKMSDKLFKTIPILISGFIGVTFGVLITVLLYTNGVLIP